MKVDRNFRDNPERGVWVTGEIGESLASALLPKIMSLRNDSSPISVYINSLGGDPRWTEIIDGALKSPNHDGHKWRIITVAVGVAASAAADLLAFGNYAIAYPNSLIHFHGAYVSKQSVGDALTMEYATSIARGLGETNAQIAMRLASASVSRSVMRFATLTTEFARIREQQSKADLTDVECFVTCLREKLTTEASHRIVSKALARCRSIWNLAVAIKGIAPKKTAAEYDAAVIQAVIKYKIKANKKDSDWDLGEPGINQVVEDYLLLRDYHLGTHTKALGKMVTRFGRSFLSADDRETFEKTIVTQPDADKRKWLWEKTALRIVPFWYLVVSIWRHLQEEENPLSPTDAYWLGS